MNKSDFSIFINSYTTATFSTLPIFILRIHYLLAEIALINIEIRWIQWQKSCQENIFYLFWLGMGVGRIMGQIITKHEATFFRGMGMEVYIDVKILMNIGIMKYSFFNCPDCRLIIL